MNEKSWLGFLISFSDNRKSKTCGERSRTIQNPKWWGLLVIPFVLVVGAVAQAQQPKKVPRIGYLPLGSGFRPTMKRDQMKIAHSA